MTRARPSRRGLSWLVGPLALLIPALACDVLKETKPELTKKAEPEAEAKAAVDPPPPVTPPETEPTSAFPVEPKIDPKTGTTPEVPPVTAEGRIQDESNTIDVFGAAAPATVFITQKRLVVDRFSMREQELPAGSGTGFVWDSDGHVVTNCHVALPDCQRGTKPASLSVTMYDQKTYEATIVGHDPFHDIAILKISTPGTTLVPVRRPDKGYSLIVGQKALAIGNPFGLDHTLTVGVISALGREVKGIGEVTIRGMVQTDAAINPGNSGGPLLDSRGQLIGMNTMIFSTSGSAAGIGFAVPVNTIERIVPQIIRTGAPERVGLGISYVEDDMARRIGIEGVIVRGVAPGSPAEKAGLHAITEVAGGLSLDVIVGIDDKRVRNFDDLYGSLEEKNAGDKVKVSVRRLPEDKVISVEVELMMLSTR
jgi:S1-C subfamily serine protease